MSWIVLAGLCLMLLGCSAGYVPITKDQSRWYILIGTKVKTEAMTVDALPDLPDSLISIGALGAVKK